MCEISAVELYVFYRDTIENCNSPTRSLPADELLYYLYEEFPVGVTSCFHDTSLENILANGLIDSYMAKLSCRIRKSWFALQEQECAAFPSALHINWQKSKATLVEMAGENDQYRDPSEPVKSFYFFHVHLFCFQKNVAWSSL